MRLPTKRAQRPARVDHQRRRGPLLREVEKRTGILAQFAACFTDQGNAERIEHTLKALAAPRVYGWALGCADLDDHDQLQQDPLLAGKSTLHRLELAAAAVDEAEGHKKIALHEAAVRDLRVRVFSEAHATPQKLVFSSVVRNLG